LQLSHAISYYLFFGLVALVDAMTQNSDVALLSRLKALLVMQELLLFRFLFIGYSPGSYSFSLGCLFAVMEVSYQLFILQSFLY
jgi:hypothetical protein